MQPELSPRKIMHVTLKHVLCLLVCVCLFALISVCYVLSLCFTFGSAPSFPKFYPHLKRLEAVVGCLCRLRREMSVSQSWLRV